MKNNVSLTEPPKGNARGLLGFPLNLDLDNLDADIVILGVLMACHIILMNYLTIKAPHLIC